MSKAAVIYWSGTGNTKAMAEAIETGMKGKDAEVDLIEVASAPKDLSAYEKIAFGCPSMGSEELEDSVFDPYFTEVENELSGKKIALFGSYGWGDGEWMRNWAERVKNKQAILLDDGLIQEESPDAAVCTAYGEKFADF
jgi:flavodoxin short chain